MHFFIQPFYKIVDATKFIDNFKYFFIYILYNFITSTSINFYMIAYNLHVYLFNIYYVIFIYYSIFLFTK